MFSAIAAVGASTVVSGLVDLFTMRETLPGREQTGTELPTASEMTR
jgi:hypothetical protein